MLGPLVPPSAKYIKIRRKLGLSSCLPKYYDKHFKAGLLALSCLLLVRVRLNNIMPNLIWVQKTSMI